MTFRSLHDGRADGLIPLESMQLDCVESFADLLRAMSQTAFGGRQLGQAFEILLEVARRESCTTVLTMSGAMTVAKQGRLVCDMIDRGLVQAIVATGALIAHGLTESIGLTHYRYDPAKSDEILFHQGYNRIYDTLEMEANLNDVERLVCSVLSEVQPEDGVWSSARLCRSLGQRLSELDEGPGILRNAFEHNVPVFIPAFTDSEIGLDVATWAISCALRGGRTGQPSDLLAIQRPGNAEQLGPLDVFQVTPNFNPFLDLQQYARLIGQAQELAIFTIGGGVPRNWAQQVGPYFDVTNARAGTRLPSPRFKYGVRICPEPVHWGGLSGCTYAEGVSWGKFVSRDDGGRYAEVPADATLVWPLLMKALFEALDGESG
jgi:deoxyhypusine synthase